MSRGGAGAARRRATRAQHEIADISTAHALDEPSDVLSDLLLAYEQAQELADTANAELARVKDAVKLALPAEVRAQSEGRFVIPAEVTMLHADVVYRYERRREVDLPRLREDLPPGLLEPYLMDRSRWVLTWGKKAV